MQNRFKISISTFLAFLTTIYLTYNLLVCDNFLQCSLSSIISHSNHFPIKKHIVVFGLLPVYIATVIFGAGIFGVYLGSKIELLYSRCSLSCNKLFA